MHWVRADASDFGGNLPIARSGHTAVNVGKSKVVVFGGFADRRFLVDISVYDVVPAKTEAAIEGFLEKHQNRSLYDSLEDWSGSVTHQLKQLQKVFGDDRKLQEEMIREAGGKEQELQRQEQRS